LTQRSEVVADMASWQEKLHTVLRCEFIAVGGTTMLAIAAETRSF